MSFVSPSGSFADLKTTSLPESSTRRIPHPGEKCGNPELRKPFSLVALEQVDAAAHAVLVDLDIREAGAGGASEDGPDRRPDVLRKPVVVRGCRNPGKCELSGCLEATLVRDFRVNVLEHVHGEIRILEEPGGAAQQLIVVACHLADCFQQGSLGCLGAVAEVLDESSRLGQGDPPLLQRRDQIRDIILYRAELGVERRRYILAQDIRVDPERGLVDVLDIEHRVRSAELPHGDQAVRHEIPGPGPRSLLGYGKVIHLDDRQCWVLGHRRSNVQEHVVDAPFDCFEGREEVQEDDDHGNREGDKEEKCALLLFHTLSRCGLI